MRTSRRQVLAGVGGIGAAAIAGCSRPQSGTQRSEKQVAWPAVTAEEAAKWSVSNTRRQQFDATRGVRPYARTRLYEHDELQADVNEKTLGQFTQPLAMFFATHIKLEGFASMFVSPGMIADRVFADFRNEMKRNGITGIEAVSVADPAPSYDASAELAEYRGTHEIPRIAKTVTIDGAGERTIEIPSKQLSITGLAAVWKKESGRAFAAGGVFPEEDYEATTGVSVSGDRRGDGIDLQVAIDLNIPVDELRSQIVEMAESVTKSDQMG